MKKLYIFIPALLALGLSTASAQKPDSVYLLGAVGTPIDAIAPDLNNDGYPDLVFVSINGDSLISMLGDGSGNFTNRQAVGVVSSFVTMTALAAADFNNDGKMDVMASSIGSINILEFLGDGTGALNLSVFGSGSPAIDIVTGNFDSYSPLNLNADIALLLWTADGTSDSVLYYFGDGTGVFPNNAVVPTGGKGAYLMTKQTQPGSLPDLDNVAVANFSSGNLGLIISNGDRSFKPTVNIPTRAANPAGIVWDFLDNDNLLDLAYTGYDDDSLFVQKGTGLTAYNAAVSYPLRANPFGLADGDFTGDGKVDLAATNLGNDSLSFYLNNGSGGFLPIINAPLGFSDRRPRAADINRNGAADVLVGAASGNFFGVFNLKAPTVTPAFLTGNPPAGSPFTLPVITARDTTNIASVKLVYRQVGKTAYDTLTLTPGAGTAIQRDYTGTMPAGAVTNRGFEYFFRTSDGFVTANSISPYNPIPYIWLQTSIAQNAPATADRAYQLVSFPFTFSPAANGSASIQIADDFSLSDPNVARLFWWDPVKADTITTDSSNMNGYREFGTAGFPNFAPSRSMFLATVGSKTYDGTGISTFANSAFWHLNPSGDSTLLLYYRSLPLDSGWNMIATPFAFTINLDSVPIYVPAVDVQLHEVTDSIRTNRIGQGATFLRERTATGYIAPSPPYLKPWRGYFLKNNVKQQVYLLFPKKDDNLPLAAPPAPARPIAVGLDWKIDVSAKSGEIETPPATLGTSKAAKEGYDQMDWELPPPLPGDMRVVFQRGKDFGAKGDYMTDFRPTLTAAESWTFTVQPGETRAIELSFDGLADVPADYDLILTDREGRTRQNLRTEPVYRFIASEDRHFELAVAPKTAGQTALLPTKYELYQNMPNPFNPQTLIKYDLPEAVNVRLEVFNILGQKVKTLVNGYETAGPKSVVWDGTDVSGNKAASGIYLYKITAGSYAAVRKMTFLK